MVDFCWTDFLQSALVDDADAAGGKAFSISKRTKPTKQLHARELIMSVYDAKGNPQYPASLKIDKKDIPQDEKFHWYYAGRMKV